jgi:hypothetical protein
MQIFVLHELAPPSSLVEVLVEPLDEPPRLMPPSGRSKMLPKLPRPPPEVLAVVDEEPESSSPVAAPPSSPEAPEVVPVAEPLPESSSDDEPQVVQGVVCCEPELLPPMTLPTDPLAASVSGLPEGVPSPAQAAARTVLKAAIVAHTTMFEPRRRMSFGTFLTPLVEGGRLTEGVRRARLSTISQ